ncbi:unnamed protein product [Cuscuta europaea]|uniref:Uncharacterized protein n=1 Tax=Cuscuta europaea TaxID=41803 RepID=A0A9P0YT03_CUSEU|nr:unnamed protein product [Cuscuta europaea]
MQGRHSHRSQLLEVQLDDGVREHPGIFAGVAFGNVDDVGLEDDGVNAGAVRSAELVDRRDAAVVVEAVLAADDAEAEDVPVVVEDLEALGAGGSGDAGDDGDLPDAADAAVAGHGAALDEMLVLLGVVEAADEAPDDGGGGVDVLSDERGAGVGQGIEGVVAADQRLQSGELLRRQPLSASNCVAHYFFR